MAPKRASGSVENETESSQKRQKQGQGPNEMDVGTMLQSIERRCGCPADMLVPLELHDTADGRGRTDDPSQWSKTRIKHLYRLVQVVSGDEGLVRRLLRAASAYLYHKKELNYEPLGLSVFTLAMQLYGHRELGTAPDTILAGISQNIQRQPRPSWLVLGSEKLMIAYNASIAAQRKAAEAAEPEPEASKKASSASNKRENQAQPSASKAVPQAAEAQNVASMTCKQLFQETSKAKSALAKLASASTDEGETLLLKNKVRSMAYALKYKRTIIREYHDSQPARQGDEVEKAILDALAQGRRAVNKHFADFQTAWDQQHASKRPQDLLKAVSVLEVWAMRLHLTNMVKVELEEYRSSREADSE